MVQNHMMQLLCLVAMEPPASLQADALRDEKLKVLKSLEPIDETNAGALTVRGQYRAGFADGGPVPSYLQDVGKHESDTETFVALKIGVANWRWAGVPFYLRTGKRLPQRFSEIVVAFSRVPHVIFDMRRRRRAGQPPGHPGAARRGHQALADDQGAGTGRHAARSTCRST